MAFFFTSEDLISSIKRKGNIPDSQDMISDDEILDYANEELAIGLMPLIVSKHEDYYLTREDFATELGVKKYAIPYRALGNKVREVAFVDASGKLSEAHRVSIDDITYGYNSNRGSGNRFYLQDESVVFDNDSNDLGYPELAFFYNIQPNKLVTSDRVSTITNIDKITGIVTVDSIPDNITASVLLDLIKYKSPHRIISYDLAPISVDVNINQIAFTPSDLPHELAVGDKICLQNETNLIYAPTALHSVLSQMVVARVLDSLGDSEGLKNANDKLARMETSASYLIDNRVTGSPIKAKARNGLLKGRRGGRSR